MHGKALLLTLLLAALPIARIEAAQYDVGPGMPYLTPSDVPWESLAAGDTVLIHHRPAPYRDKWVITAQGTAAAPITVRGVAGTGGELPVITGDGAVTRQALDYWNEVRSVVKVGGSSVPADVMPQHIVLEGLDIRSARPPYTFTDDQGAVQTYADNGASIHVEKGENITVRGCVLQDSGNGFFVSSSDTVAARDILVEGCYLHDNGIDGSIYQHNNYTAALGITFQYNRFGPLRPDCGGNNLKDRSAGLVVRYNWIEGANRQLDLVDAEDSVLLQADPAYRSTFVYGNVLIETEGAGNRQILHYGGDSGNTPIYRKGMLYFYNNTVVSYRTDRTTLMRLSTAEERADCRNNIVYTAAAAGGSLSLLDADGVLDWSRNWVKPGWAVCFGTFTGTLNDDGTSVEGSAPGFGNEPAQDFRLDSGSGCRDAGRALPPAVLPIHDVTREYVKHQGGADRAVDATLDIGAYEHAQAAAPIAEFAGAPRSGPAPLNVQFTDLSSGGPASWSWDFEDDGAPDSAAQHPAFTYAAPGVYGVRLAVANPAGSDEEAKAAYICVTAAPLPVIADLVFREDRETLVWQAVEGASSYDVVRGDLTALRAGSGDYAASLLGCMEDDGADLEASDPGVPPPGGAFYYLVRPVHCGTAGTYDGPHTALSDSRDAGVASSPNHCP